MTFAFAPQISSSGASAASSPEQTVDHMVLFKRLENHVLRLRGCS